MSHASASPCFTLLDNHPSFTLLDNHSSFTLLDNHSSFTLLDNYSSFTLLDNKPQKGEVGSFNFPGEARMEQKESIEEEVENKSKINCEFFEQLRKIGVRSLYRYWL